MLFYNKVLDKDKRKTLLKVELSYLIYKKMSPYEIADLIKFLLMFIEKSNF